MMAKEKFLTYDAAMDMLSDKTQALLSKAVESTQAMVNVTPKLSDTSYKTRGAHAKSYAYVEAEFSPNNLLVNQLGLNAFFKTNQHLLVRFSNANNVIQEERKNFPAYGMSLQWDSGISYPLVNFPLFPTDDVDSFLQLFIELNEARVAQANEGFGAVKNLPSLLMSGLKAFFHINPLNLGNLLYKGAQMDKDFLMNYAYHGIGCYRFGAYVGKIHTEQLHFKLLEEDKENTQLITLQDILKKQAISFKIYVQLGVSEDETPVNILSKEWNKDIAPWQELGTIVIAQQQVRENNTTLEGISFNPFKNPEELQPVGRIQQTRKPVYDISYATRIESI